MRRIVTVGVFSVAAAFYAACSDDGSDGGIGGDGGGGGSGGSAGSSSAGAAGGGNGGTANNAGSAGTAGVGGSGVAGQAGTGGNGGSAGVAGSGSNNPDAGDGGPSDTDGGIVGDAGGDAAVAPPCTGCVELRSGTFTAASETTFFQLVFSSIDASAVVATFHLRSLTLDEGGQLFAQTFATDNSGFTFGAGTFKTLNAANFTNTDTFIDVPLDIGAISSANFDDTDVIAVGIQVGTGGGFTGTAQPVLLLDSITFTGANAPANLDFTADAQNFAVNTNAGVFADASVTHH